MKYTIDSSFWVSFFYVNDVNHEKAKEIFIEKNLIDKDIIINSFIVEEVTTILTYKWWKELWDNFLEALEVFNLIYSSVSIKDYILFYKNINNKISFADTSILYDAIYYNTKLITFDKQQETIYLNIKY